MAWGARRGIDDVVQRVASNDARLEKLCLLPQRQFGDREAEQLCKALQQNTVLKELAITSHAVSPAAAAAFAEVLAASNCLASLSLGNRSFGDEGLAALCPGIEKSSSLRQLNLDAKGLTPAGCAALAAALAVNGSVRELTLADNDLRQEGLAALVPGLLKLEQLDISSTGLEGPAAWEAVAEVLRSGALQVLRCGGNALCAEGAAALAPALAGASLRELHLPGCALDGAGMRALAGSLPPALEVLDVSGCGVGAEGAAALGAALAAGGGCRLRSLVLCGCSIEEQGLVRLADGLALLVPEASSSGSSNSSGGSGELDLDVGGNSAAGGADALRALAGCRLASLRLHGCGLGAAGAAELARLLEGGGFAALGELDVSACGLGAEGLLGLLAALRGQHPASCPRLRLLVLAANEGLEEEGVQAAVEQLQEARPALVVVRRAADSGELGAGGRQLGAS